MAAIVLTFDTNRRRPTRHGGARGTAEIVPFLGVRYQRQDEAGAALAGRDHDGPADPRDGGGNSRCRQ